MYNILFYFTINRRLQNNYDTNTNNDTNNTPIWIISGLSVIILIILIVYILKRYYFKSPLINNNREESIIVDIDNDDTESESSSLIKTSPGISLTTSSFGFDIEKDPHNYFNQNDLSDVSIESKLHSKFQYIMSKGIQISLFTSKGPRPILLTLIEYEIRWQAVKAAKKRYKLHLKDIIGIEKGKKTMNFSKNISSNDMNCFSLLTNRTTLDLEVNSFIDRDCLVIGFQKKLMEVKEYYRTKESSEITL